MSGTLVNIAFVKWVMSEGWKFDQRGFWYKGNSWPPQEEATDKELLEMFFGK